MKNPHAWRELGLSPYFRRKKSAEVIAPKAILWQQLEEKAGQCTLCRLHETRTQVVFGMGDQNADWFFIGEGPGEQEDLQGKPFVGPAGKLLDEMLKALGLCRTTQVYIANIVKCRPPQNRVPKPDEIQSCLPYLLEQIRLVEPKIIVILGKTAASTLLEQDEALAKLRGNIHAFAGIPLIVTYHPAYLLRNPADKKKSWQDLQLAWQVINGRLKGG